MDGRRGRRVEWACHVRLSLLLLLFSYLKEQRPYIFLYIYISNIPPPIRIIPLALLLPRSRQIPDFALTIHFLHLLITTIYTSYNIPTNLLWWGLEAASASIMISLGVWASRYREMRPISFGLPTANKKPAGTEANGEAGVPLMQGASGSGGNNTNNSNDQSYEMRDLRGDENV